jgi:superfamily II DNA or RNA helicase
MLFQIDEKRLARQQQGIELWGKFGKGTLKYMMGFGKTYVGIQIIKRLLDKHKNGVNIHIVVPNDYARTNWLNYLTEFNLSNEVNVLTANTIVINKYFIHTDLLIIDEIHKFTSDERLKIIRGEYIKYRWNLGLTGSRITKDIEMYFPIIDEISETEALSNKWISNFVEYNLALTLPDKDKLRYEQYSIPIGEILSMFKGSCDLFNQKSKSVFKNDYDILTSCFAGKKIPNNYISATLIRNTLAEKKGWNPSLELTNDYNLMLEDNWNPNIIEQRARMFNDLVKRRNDILINHPLKLKTVLDIYNKFKCTTICFNESTEFASSISDYLNAAENHVAICYHSNIESRYLCDENGNTITTKDGKPKKFGKGTLLKMAISGIENGFYKFLSTVRALDEALNIPNIEMVITTAGDTNPMRYAQRNARGKRVDIYNPNKVTKIINIYFDNFYNLDNKLVISRDLTKLKLRQNEESNNVIWINDINDID